MANERYKYEDGKLLVSTKELAERRGVSIKTIAEYCKRGMPKEKHGWYDLWLALEWLNGGEKADITEADRLEADVKLKRAKEELARIEIAVKNGELVEMSVVKTMIEQEFVKLRTFMLGIGDKVMAEIVMQYPELATQVRKSINANIRAGLTELANSKGEIKPTDTSRPRKKAGRPRKNHK